MTDQVLYRNITKEDLGNDIDHLTLNMIVGDNVKEIKTYLRKFLILLIHYYGANRLKLNNIIQERD